MSFGSPVALPSADDGGRVAPAHLGVEMEGRKDFFTIVTTCFTVDLSPFIDEPDVLLHYSIDPKGQGTFRGALCALGPDTWGDKSREWVLHQAFPMGDESAQDDAVVEERMRDTLGLPDVDLEIQSMMR